MNGSFELIQLGGERHGTEEARVIKWKTPRHQFLTTECAHEYTEGCLKNRHTSRSKTNLVMNPSSVSVSECPNSNFDPI